MMTIITQQTFDRTIKKQVPNIGYQGMILNINIIVQLSTVTILLDHRDICDMHESIVFMIYNKNLRITCISYMHVLTNNTCITRVHEVVTHACHVMRSYLLHTFFGWGGGVSIHNAIEEKKMHLKV